jgi:hypothetical protein
MGTVKILAQRTLDWLLWPASLLPGNLAFSKLLSDLQDLGYTTGFTERKPHARARRKARPILDRGA